MGFYAPGTCDNGAGSPPDEFDYIETDNCAGCDDVFDVEKLDALKRCDFCREHLCSYCTENKDGTIALRDGKRICVDCALQPVVDDATAEEISGGVR